VMKVHKLVSPFKKTLKVVILVAVILFVLL
jgi:hypothetical protein